MANFFIFLLMVSSYGIVQADFNGPFGAQAQFSPRYAADSGNSNYNTYNGADNYGPNGLENNGVGANRPNGGDALASFGLGGLSGFYSSLSSELVNAGNNFGGSGQDSGNTAALPANNNPKVYPLNVAVTAASANSPVGYQARPGPSANNANGNNYANANPASNLNLADNSLLKQYGLEQLGNFFGSMVSELNNAGSNGGLNGLPPVDKPSGSNYAQTTTPSIPSSTTYTEASR